MPEITPTDSDPCSPNGVPSAATGAPTTRSALEPSVSGPEREARWIDAQQRDVGVRIGPDDLRGNLVAVGELHVDGLGALKARAGAVGDDVRVGDDLATRGDHESGSLGRRAPPVPSAGSAAGERADHGHHAGRVAIVDRARVEPRALGDLHDRERPGGCRGAGRLGSARASRVVCRRRLIRRSPRSARERYRRTALELSLMLGARA